MVVNGCKKVGQPGVEKGKTTALGNDFRAISIFCLRSKPVKSGSDHRLDSSMVFNSEPLQDVLRKVFGSAKAGYILFGEMMSRERFVTADVRNQTLKEALARILESAGLRDFEIMETLEDPASYFIRVRSGR